MFYSRLPTASFPVCGFLSCLEWRSWSHGWSILSMFIAFLCKTLRWMSQCQHGRRSQTLNVCISNCPSHVSHFPWVFRLLAMSLWDLLHVSSIHAGTGPNIVIALPLFQLLCLFTAASTSVWLPATVSPTDFPALHHLHNLCNFLFLTHPYSQQAWPFVTLAFYLSLLGFL